MVLSNKKLKQKLRAEIAESLAKTSISNSFDSNPANPDETPKSLKQLLGSTTRKPSLSKREKLRQTINFRSSEVGNGENAENEGAHSEETENGQKKKKKKRKREKKEKGDQNSGGVDGELGVKEEGDGLEKGGKDSKKKKKKKEKKKKNKSKDGKQEKQSEVEYGVVAEQCVAQNVDYNSQGNNEDKKKVYVGGIPYYSTEEDIRSFFDHCGTITDVDCMTFPETGKFRGIAIISFKTEEAAKRALAIDGSDMGGLYLIAKPYKATRATKTTTTDFSPPVLAGYNRIYAGNLSWEITEDDLRNLFSDCNLSAIRFGEDKETGEFKGYAHVDFADNASLAKALKLDQTVVCGRPVRIRCAVPPKKGAITNSGSVSTTVKAEAVNNEAEAPNNGVTSSKIKRRTCYECGERGHISSACPKKQSNEENNPNGG